MAEGAMRLRMNYLCSVEDFSHFSFHSYGFHYEHLTLAGFFIKMSDGEMAIEIPDAASATEGPRDSGGKYPYIDRLVKLGHARPHTEQTMRYVVFMKSFTGLLAYVFP